MEFSFFFFFLLFTLCFSSVSVHSTFIPYNTSSSVVPAKINVHLVPHSHDDVGWLKTVDQYYFGGNNSIRIDSSQVILHTLILFLSRVHVSRMFWILSCPLCSRIRIASSSMWRWRVATIASVSGILPEMVAAAKQCNEGEGQGARQLWSTRIHVSTTSLHFLSFFFSPNYGNITPISSFCGVVVTINSSHRVSDVCLFDRNGGMCMHDEATPHYIDLIDQTTLGHKFIQDEFGQVPRVGWQIDPFGHSAVQAYLLGAEIGFDSLFFARIDYQDRAKRLKDKTLEVVWRGSQSLGSTSQIFTGIFPRHYDPPDGFTFEVNDVSPPIQDDVLLFDYNVQERVNDFVAAALAQANVTRTNHVMWLMGTDFRYQYANSWYRQMDKFIHYVNQDGRVNVLYSTPSMYTDAKHAADEEWPLKTGDFFPYADHPNAYWTGYFTSRPAFKGYVRTMSGYYLAARQLEFFGGMIGALSKTDVLADALAIAQHHDAVSGTQRQHVAADYALRISIGYKECPLLNISYCPPSESVLSDGQSLVVVAYNPLGWKREEVIRIPVTSEEVKVHDSNGKVIESQLLPLLNATLRVRTTYGKAYMGDFPSGTPNYWLAFLASLPPLGFNTYFVSAANHTGPSSTISQVHTSENSTRRTVEVGPGNLKLHFSVDEGRLTHVSNTRSLVATPVGQSYGYYTGNDGTTNDPQASGAYVFRPNETITIKHVDKIPLTIMKGPLLDEVHQQLSPWISQITRVYKGKDHAEIEFSIGPIPVEDGTGKEITTQIITSLKTNKTFYTDSNGRDFIKRIRDQRTDWELEVNQPVAGNYYPINLGIYVQDDSTELSVLVDRSVGGSSLVDGQIELMLHRRMIHDDVRGVGEVLNETVCVLNECEGLTVIGKIFLKVDNLGEGAKWRRTVGQELYSPVLVAFTKQEAKDNWMDSHIQSFSGIDPSYSLPNNVAIITLQELENGKVLIRLAHLYEVGEDKDYSGMARVELKKLFPNKKIRKAMELSLSANQERSEMEKRRLVWKVASSGESNVVVRGGVVDPVDLVVELAPMEIRTFHIDLEKSFHSQIYES
ncbi:Alpha-mannosidase At3g26720 [Linum perenne]